jgi:hypothetical protein
MNYQPKGLVWLLIAYLDPTLSYIKETSSKVLQVFKQPLQKEGYKSGIYILTSYKLNEIGEKGMLI